ncbi:hypothetical protein [Chryseobacterium oryctis]|uniref:Uncharacterized protein n=1 Tax=Chryseobacterium oryctis TaxID=2952618 RepID=A0ABT3HQI8_9FLAO|nr:hypothetical protein [Chryseobacterium oryctis]MCW3162056.1 hypothetical protein [Chryseobacterium oryctis]
MKTLKSSKTLQLDLDSNYDVYLEIHVSSTGNCSTLVTIDNNPSFKYEERVLLGKFNQLKNKIVVIEHIFSFENIPEANVDNAMQQSQITYRLISVMGPTKPFKNKTSADLIDDRIGAVKLIRIK